MAVGRMPFLHTFFLHRPCNYFTQCSATLNMQARAHGCWPDAFSAHMPCIAAAGAYTQPSRAAALLSQWLQVPFRCCLQASRRGWCAAHLGSSPVLHYHTPCRTHCAAHSLNTHPSVPCFAAAGARLQPRAPRAWSCSGCWCHFAAACKHQKVAGALRTWWQAAFRVCLQTLAIGKAMLHESA